MFLSGDPAILRLLDANANRAREALRVMEDYARFVLDDAGVSLSLKTLRHNLAAALALILPEAILHRDTPGDVGVSNKTVPEMQRGGLEDVVAAAGKRLGEALRALEEYSKTIDAPAAAKIEAIRYASYDVEMRLARTLHPGNRFAGVKLCVLITESLCRVPWLDAATAALDGGADCLQLREKDMEGGELLNRAKILATECHRWGKLLIINDRPDIAVLSGADGVHVGQGDLPAVEARKIIGSRLVLGVSTHNLAQAKQAVMDGADYVGIGPVFPSKTKPRDFLPGLAALSEVAAGIKIPAVAIAGITMENVDEVLAAGGRAIAVSSAILDSDDIKAATERLRAKLV